MVELGDSLKQEGVVNPLPALMNSSEGKYTGQAALKSCKVEIMDRWELEKRIALECVKNPKFKKRFLAHPNDK